MSPNRFGFPKSARLLKSAEFRRVYQEGSRFVGPLFAAFYRRSDSGKPVRVGYTTPKAIGKAVARNRIKRRLREAVRVELPSAGPGWDIVFNPRRAVLDADFSRVKAEVERLFGVLRSHNEEGPHRRADRV